MKKDSTGRIASTQLSFLWEQIKPISHKEFPFLDQLYSPGSLMPAADFSPWVSERLLANDWGPITELLGYICYDTLIPGLRKSFQSYSFSKFLSAEESLLSELKAIAVLSYRMPWSGQPSSRTHLISELYSHSLAAHPFAIHESVLPQLLSNGNSHITKENEVSLEYGGSKWRDLIQPEKLEDLKEFSPSSVGLVMAQFPVTFRACIAYSLYRGSRVPDTIKPQHQGHYGLRCFGLSSEQNQYFTEKCGLFSPPNDLAALANSLQKADLLTIGQSSGIKLMKSWKKDKMISILLSSEDAKHAIADEYPKHLMRFKNYYKSEFDLWRTHTKKLESLALCLSVS